MIEVIINDPAHGVRVVKKDLPIVIAPCQPDGRVTTIDNDNKGAICRCSFRTCWVDGRNHVIHDDDELFRIEYIN